MKHHVKVGDQLLVEGSLFIITKLEVEIDKPSVLTTKQPIEMIDTSEST